MVKNPHTLSKSEVLLSEIWASIDKLPEGPLETCLWGCDTVTIGKRYVLTPDQAYRYERDRPNITSTKEFPFVRIIREAGKYVVEAHKASA